MSCEGGFHVILIVLSLLPFEEKSNSKANEFGFSAVGPSTGLPLNCPSLSPPLQQL